MGRPKKEPTARERIEDSYDAKVGNEPLEKEEPQEKAIESPHVDEYEEPKPQTLEDKEQEVLSGKDKVEEVPKRKYAGKFDNPDDLEKSYLEAEKKMHEEGQKRATVEQEFQRIRNYIDWDKLKKDAYGEPVQSQPKNIPPMDKEQFFQKFAEKGPELLDEYISQSPAVQKAAQQYLQNLWPNLIQNVSYRVKLEDVYDQFLEKYPHLKRHEEQVFKLMLGDLQKDPKKNLSRAMNDAAKEMQKEIDGWKEEGRREAQTIHEEKKQDNLPPGDRLSKERIVETKHKVEEDKPESVSDIINWRRNLQDRGKTRVGYQYKK